MKPTQSMCYYLLKVIILGRLIKDLQIFNLLYFILYYVLKTRWTKFDPPWNFHPGSSTLKQSLFHAGTRLYLAVSQPPVVRSEHVRTFFDSTQSQVSYSEVGLRNGTRQCALGPIMGSTLYLWCLGSNLDVWDQFLHLQILRNPNLI